jgi:4-amino-4-deoxy-L-arabinose transferase-like glycosyltransferase
VGGAQDGLGTGSSRLLSPNYLLLYLAVADFIGHMPVAGNYGYFRDELYYIVSGQHLQLGYVDFPPMIAYIAAMLYPLTQDSLVSIHVVPALVGSVLVFVSGLIAREMGGGRVAQVLAALAVLVSAQLAFASIFSMDVIDALWWTLISYLIVRLIKYKNERLWLLIGLVAGIGLMTKLTIAFFLIAVVIGLFVSSRRVLVNRWFVPAVLIAIAIVSPYIIWNAMNGWPTVDFYIGHGGLNGSGPADFVLTQLLIFSPVNLPLVVAGLLFYFRKQGREYRVLGLAFVILFAFFVLTNGKPYFLFAAYPALLAGGAVFIERLSRRRWPLSTYAGVLALSGLVLAPIFMPVLSPVAFVQYYGPLTGAANGAAAQGTGGPFPQYLGDRFGWDTMVTQVSDIYHNLTPTQQESACVFTSNYGEASALIFLGAGRGLPPVISGHNNYYLWGPGRCTGQVLLTVGVSAQELSPLFGNVTQVGTITCQDCMSSENGIPVYLCTGPLFSIGEVWPQTKDFS